jgi:hypothetical protein
MQRTWLTQAAQIQALSNSQLALVEVVLYILTNQISTINGL